MKKKLPEQFEISIERINKDGEGVGRFKNRSIFVFGALPGEVLLVRPVKLGKGKAWAVILEILEKSKDRRKERDDHYLSCSPWQIVEDEKQLDLKVEIVEDLFDKNNLRLPEKDIPIGESKKPWNYRNKMEFSFSQDKKGDLVLAFHVRGRRYDMYELDRCALAHERINACGKRVIKALRKNNVLAEDLKTLVIRYSYYEKKCIASLFVTKENFKGFDISDISLKGWIINYSDPLSPASVVTKRLHRYGKSYLYEKVDKYKFKYFYDGFFQINPLTFNKIIKYIKNNIKKGENLVDLYSGVGTIGFCLHKYFKNIYSVEYDKKSVKAAEKNIEINKLKNITLFSGAAEKQDLDEIMSFADTLIVDPPRSGLHPKVVEAVLSNKPKQFVYVSCNPITQTRDLEKLKKVYKIRKIKLFDMYPQTPHVESVVILKKRLFR